MDLLLGEGTCDLALQNWRQTIDKIIEVAKKSSNTAIVKTKKQYAQEDMNDFGKKGNLSIILFINNDNFFFRNKISFCTGVHSVFGERQ